MKDTEENESSLLRWIRRVAGLAGGSALLCLFAAKTLSRSPEMLATSKMVTGLAVLLAAVSGSAAVVTWLLRARQTSGPDRHNGYVDEDLDLDHETPPPAGPVEERWMPLSVKADRMAIFSTHNGEPIDLPSDGPVEAAYRFQGTHREEDEMIDFLRVETRLRDRDGKWWSAETYLDPSALTLPIRPDLAPSDSVDQVEAYYWRDTPDSWRNALLQRSLASDVLDSIDTRDRYRLWVSNEWAIILLKYQGPSCDVSRLDDLLLIRAKQMVLEHWRVDPWTEGDISQKDRLDIIDNVSICFTLEPRFLSLFEAPDQHFATWDQCLRRHDEQSPEERRPAFEPSAPPSGR